MYQLHYCNPAALIGTYDTLADALAQQDRDYCQYVVRIEGNQRTIVWSTARDNPRMKVGYSWRY
jgi:hypothetical protein